MARKEDINKLPRKFRKLKKSFVDNLTVDNNSSFLSFPSGLTFHGQESGEEVVLLIRAHWIIYTPHVLTSILLFILPFLLYKYIPGVSGNVGLFLGIMITSFMTAFSVLVNAYVHWFYNINIITDQRVLDIDYVNIMAHSVSEAQLEKIEDITHKQLGLIGSLFDVGTVYIQTAGSKTYLEFQNVPRPRDVQDILNDMMELKQKQEI